MAATSSGAVARLPQLLQRFRAREISKVVAQGRNTSAGDLKTIEIQNPFLPWKNPKTGRWAPALYSRRRQKELIKSARSLGLHGEAAVEMKDALGLLPLGPMMDRITMQKMVSTAEGQSSSSSRNKTSSPIQAQPGFTNVSGEARAANASLSTLPEITWHGEPKARDVAGADIGARLYAGKKRMFKGHKWERNMKKRQGEIRVRMRDMPKRINRFRGLYKRLKPSPFRPPSARRKATLPF